MKKRIAVPLLLLILLSGCSSNKRMQSHYLSKAINAFQAGDCVTAIDESMNLKERTVPSDENLANVLLIESSCYLNNDKINPNHAKGGFEYIAEQYPNTVAGYSAKSILSDWDNVIKESIALKIK